MTFIDLFHKLLTGTACRRASWSSERYIAIPGKLDCEAQGVAYSDAPLLAVLNRQWGEYPILTRSDLLATDWETI